VALRVLRGSHFYRQTKTAKPNNAANKINPPNSVSHAVEASGGSGSDRTSPS
jgi:hypothetical protein